MSQANPDAAYAEDRIATPGMLLIVGGGLAVLLAVATMLQGLFGFADGVMQSMGPRQAMDSATSGTMIVVWGVVNLFCAFLVTVAGWKARQLEGRGLVILGSLVAMVPCTISCACFPWSALVGIWMLATLRDPRVAGSFQ